MSTDVWTWLKELDVKYPPFDPTKWTPLSQKHPELPVKELWKKVGQE